jgi:hypothetical protein
MVPLLSLAAQAPVRVDARPVNAKGRTKVPDKKNRDRKVPVSPPPFRVPRYAVLPAFAT